MIQINLLPHREEKRKARRIQFYALAAIAMVLAGATLLIGYVILSGYVSAQESTNVFLKKEIDSLDKDIAEIKKLREETEALLARKRVIESLQANRAETVHLFNELARQVPSGIYLKSIKQSGQKVTLQGYTQTNTRVSTLMHNLEESPLLENPSLHEIKATTVDKRRVGEFNLDINLVRQTTEEKGKGGKANPAGTASPAQTKEQKP